MHLIKRKIGNTNGFLKSVTILVSGTILGQGIAILSSPIITRLYEPEDFGILGFYIALISVISVVSSLRYELAIPIAETDEDAFSLVILCFIILSISSLSIGLFILVFSTFISETFKFIDTNGLIWLLPPGNFLIGSYQILNYWAIRKKSFSKISRTKLFQGVGTVTTQIIFASNGAISLIIGYLIGQSAGITSLARNFKASTSETFISNRKSKISFYRILENARKYSNFPKFTAGSGLLNSLGMQAPNILFASFFGTASAGYFSLAYRIVTLPVSIIGQAIANTFLSRASVAYRTGDLDKLVCKILVNLFCIIVPPMLFLAFFGTNLFALIFGKDWGQAGTVASLLALTVIAQFCTSPLSQIYAVTESQKLGLISQIVLTTLRIGSILIGLLSNNFIVTVTFFSVASFTGYIFFLYFALKSASVQPRKLLRTLAKRGFLILVTFIPVLISIYGTQTSIIHIISAIFSTILIIKFHYLSYKRWGDAV